MTLGCPQKKRETTMKKHQDETYLREQIALGKTSKDIATENNVSYKLVEIYLAKHRIPFTPRHA